MKRCSPVAEKEFDELWQRTGNLRLRLADYYFHNEKKLITENRQTQQKAI
jgi:hypothetical protein